MSLPAAPASRRKQGEKPRSAAAAPAREDLAGVQRRQRDLRGADQVQLVLGNAVDLLLGVGKHAGAEERLLAHEHRRDHRREAPLLEQRQRPLHQRELEPHERALEVGEARARHARPRLHVQVVAEQLHVVAPGPARLADLADHLVRVGGARVWQVGQRHQHRGAPLLHRAQLLVQLLLALGEPAHLGDRLRGVLTAALQLPDPLARLVLARAQVLQLRQQRSPALVELERLVQDGRIDAAPCEPLTRRLGSSRISLRSSIATPPRATSRTRGPSTFRGTSPPRRPRRPSRCWRA